MKITIIGCGNAFSKINNNQSFMLEENGKKLIVDVGTRAWKSFDDFGINPSDIDAVYISHLHSDHCGGLEELAFSTYDWANRPQRWDDYKKLENVGTMKPYAIKLFGQNILYFFPGNIRKRYRHNSPIKIFPLCMFFS